MLTRGVLWLVGPLGAALGDGFARGENLRTGTALLPPPRPAAAAPLPRPLPLPLPFPSAPSSSLELKAADSGSNEGFLDIDRSGASSPPPSGGPPTGAPACVSLRCVGPSGELFDEGFVGLVGAEVDIKLGITKAPISRPAGRLFLVGWLGALLAPPLGCFGPRGGAGGLADAGAFFAAGGWARAAGPPRFAAGPFAGRGGGAGALRAGCPTLCGIFAAATAPFGGAARAPPPPVTVVVTFVSTTASSEIMFPSSSVMVVVVVMISVMIVSTISPSGPSSNTVRVCCCTSSPPAAVPFTPRGVTLALPFLVAAVVVVVGGIIGVPF